jgi:hypothetical protein
MIVGRQAGWPDEFVKKSPEMYPNPCFAKKYTTCTAEQCSQKIGYFFNFLKTSQSKQSPKRPKFAQSGHPAACSDNGKFFDMELCLAVCQAVDLCDDANMER